MRRFDVGVLGVGYWGRKIVDEYGAIQGVKVKAVSDLLDKNLEYCRDRHRVEDLHHHYRHDHDARYGAEGHPGAV